MLGNNLNIDSKNFGAKKRKEEYTYFFKLLSTSLHKSLNNVVHVVDLEKAGGNDLTVKWMQSPELSWERNVTYWECTKESQKIKKDHCQDSEQRRRPLTLLKDDLRSTLAKGFLRLYFMSNKW